MADVVALLFSYGIVVAAVGAFMFEFSKERVIHIGHYFVLFLCVAGAVAAITVETTDPESMANARRLGVAAFVGGACGFHFGQRKRVQRQEQE